MPAQYRVLLSRGADVDTRDNHGRTSLFWAGINYSPGVLKALLDAGADVNARDKKGGTPLHWAALFGCAESVNSLLSAGADVNAKDTVNGMTPLNYALAIGNHATANVLRAHGAK